MIKIRRFNEIMNSTVKFKKVAKGQYAFKAKFEIDGAEFTVLSRLDEFGYKCIIGNKKYRQGADYYELMFVDSDESYEATEKGKDQFKIFSGVIQILKKYLDKEKPQTILFPASENDPTRLRLYRHFSQNVEKYFYDYYFVGEIAFYTSEYINLVFERK